MRRIVAYALATLLLLLAGTSRADTERRVALVIGNNAYQHLPRLANPANDAELIATTLKAVGFQLIGGKAQTDLDRTGFERAIRRFGTELAGGAVGLFYYAGHGLQVQGENFLVPVAANPTTVADVDFELIDVSIVLKQMEAAGSKLNMIILDACRNNPFGGRGLRDASSGLAPMRAPRGTLISYATQPGNVAMDGITGHSPYTAALADSIKRPGLQVWEMFNEVGLVVRDQTGGRQEPYINSSPIEGVFYFAGPKEPSPSPNLPEITTASDSPPRLSFKTVKAEPMPTNSAAAVESTFWRTIAQSTNTADFEEYLQKYPNGEFAGLARNRLASLRTPLPPSTSDTAENRTSLRTLADQFINRYWDVVNGNKESVLNYIDATYASMVEYYGKLTPKTEILQQKERYLSRWPNRLSWPATTYPPDISCDDAARECIIKGIREFRTTNPETKTQSIGHFTYIYKVRFNHEIAEIIGEDSQVVFRNVPSSSK